MSNDKLLELQKRIESSAELSGLRNRVADALNRTAGNTYSFDPLLIIAVISIMIQVIQYCREKRSAEDIAADLKNVQALPPRKKMRFKRRANVLWKQYCAENGLSADTPNPIMDAVYALGADASPGAITELVDLAA